MLIIALSYIISFCKQHNTCKTTMLLLPPYEIFHHTY